MQNGGLQTKAPQVPAVSRSISLSHSTQLREGEESNFRSYKEEVMRQRNIKMEWKQRAEEKFARGAEEKQEVAQVKERKRLTKMDELKGVGGPFTCADEVRLYLDKEELSEREKQKRLKKEVQFARERTTLPSSDTLFNIQAKLPNKKRKDKNSEEFGASLMTFLGKKADDNVMKYNLFKSSLRKYTNSDGINN